MSSNKKSDNSTGSAGKPLRGSSSPKTASAKKAPAKTVKGAVAARRPAASSSGVARPRIRASHADGPAAELSDKEKEKRRTRAKATVRSLGGARTTGAKRNLPPPPSKRDPAPPRSVQEKRRSLPPSATGDAAEPSAAARDMALTIAGAGLDKKAIGIEVINVAGRVDYADYLVIMTGTSDRHVHAIAMGIEEALKKKRIAPLSIEGLSSAVWVLMDFDDIVVHVFQEETRRVYDIEGLWMDASRLPVDAVPHA